MKRLLLCFSLLGFAWVTASPALAQVGYGSAVVINDGEVVVGEPGNYADTGYVYVYVYRPVDGEWTEVGSIVASDATEADGFGTAIVAEGDMMLISAVAEERSVVYLFERADGEWNEIGTLEPSGNDDHAGFGSSMDFDAETGNLIVGAADAEDGWGAAYLFRREDGSWRQQARIVGERGEIEERADERAEAEAAGENTEEISEPTPEGFGRAVAIQGDWAFVGAPNSYQQAGRVYAFRSVDGRWEPAPMDLYSNPPDNYGAALELEGDLLLIGAPNYQPLGAVRRFQYDADGESWVRLGSVFSFEGSGYQFGASMEIDDNTMYITSPNHVTNGGMMYLYHMDGDYNVSSIEKVTAPGAAQPSFGVAFAVDGDTLAVGIPAADGGAGSALIMENTYGNWSVDSFISDYKGLDPITGSTIACNGGVADRFACDGVDLLAFLPLAALGGGRGTMANDVWGWTDPETEVDYALVGLSDATAFVDVSDPNNPVYVGRLPKTESAPAATWRDIKIDENWAYIVADGAPTHGVQIFNLEHLRGFDGEPITFEVDNHYDDISAAHNIVINEDTAFAYVVGANGGGETCGGGLHMINIEDPNNPIFAGCFADVSTGIQGTGYSHDAQCVVYHGPDERYQGHEICIGSNETAISVADVTDKRNPVSLGAATYPNVAYSHQGWFTDDHKYFYMNDEGDEASGLVEGTRTLIWDLQELDDPILAGEYVSDNPAIDHNLYVKGNLMFQSNYDSGLRVFDVSDPENIRPVAFFDTVPWGPDGGGMTGSWSNYPYFDSGIVVVTSMNEGVFIVRPKEDIGQ